MSACVKLNVFQSKPESEFGTNTTFSGYDKDTHLRWLITNDKDNLYVRFDTDDGMTKFKILRGGLKLYIDTLGKKKQKMFLNFPISEGTKLTAEDMNASMQNEGGVSPQMMAQLTESASFTKNGKTKNFNSLMSGNGFDLSLKNTGPALEYYAAIPLTRIKKGGLRDISTLSIGIVTHSIEVPSNNSSLSNPNASVISDNMPGSMSTNRQPGDNLRSAGGTDNLSGMISPISIWFGVNLLRE